MGEYRALFVANNQYAIESGFPKLGRSIDDARVLVEALETNGIEKFNFDFCFDETANLVLHKAGNFFSSAATDDFLLFYFSGHSRKDDDNELFLALRDTELKQLYSTGLSAVTLKKIINKSAARCKLIILDCCYSGAFVKWAKTDNLTIDIGKYFQGKGTVILTSSNVVQLSYEGDDDEHPSFTHYLAEGLKTGAADRDLDQLISVEEWFQYAQDQVAKWKKQDPQMYYYRRHQHIYIGKILPSQPSMNARISPRASPSNITSEEIAHNSLPHPEPAPLQYTVEVISQNGASFWTVSLINSSNAPLTQVQIIGLTKLSESLLVSAPISILPPRGAAQCSIIYDYQLAQLYIIATDFHGRPFLPLPLNLKYSPPDNLSLSPPDDDSHTNGIPNLRQDRDDEPRTHGSLDNPFRSKKGQL